jgi:type III secretion protein U
MSEEKKKPPTQRKLEKAREEGESVHSADATAAGVLLFATLFFWTASSMMGGHLARLFAIVWDSMLKPTQDLRVPIYAMLSELLWLTLPLALVLTAGGVLALALQGSVTASMDPVMFKFEKVNPAEGLKRIFSVRTFTDALLMVVKLVVISVLLWATLRSMLPLMVGVMARPPLVMGELFRQELLRLLAIGTAVFLVFGLLDYGLQRFLFIRDHRMDEDEVKRENKENFGNPQVKSKRKEVAKELLFGEPKKAVKSSSMVVANPTHFAVAIYYQRGDVPRVTAKGVDAMALLLRSYAEESGVPVLVNPPLARTLHKVPLGAGIPPSCYEAVAALLHTVSQLRAPQISAPVSGDS